MTHQMVYDEEEGVLVIDGDEYYFSHDEDCISIPRWILEEIKVQDLPHSVPIQAVVRVLGGRDEYNNDGIVITNEEDGATAEVSESVFDPLADGYFDIDSDFLKKEYLYLSQSLILAEQEGLIQNHKISEIKAEGYFTYSCTISIPNTEWSVTEAIEYAENFNKQRAVISENPESLLNVLRLVRDSHEDDSKKFSREYLPMLSKALGYQPGELILDYRLNNSVTDGIATLSLEVYPWLSFHTFGKKRSLNDEELRTLLDSQRRTMNSLAAVFLCPSGLVFIKEGGLKKFPFSRIDRTKTETILKELGRTSLAASTARLSKTSNQVIPYLVDIDKVKNEIEQIEYAVSHTDKGKTFEKISALLLEGMKCVRVKYRNLVTQTSEIDLICEYLGDPRSSLFEALGRYFIVECKNWKETVGAKHIRDFHGKMDAASVQLGIFFSRNGISGKTRNDDAQGEIRGIFKQHKRLIIVITLDDVKAIIQGANLHAIIDERCDRIIFNMP